MSTRTRPSAKSRLLAIVGVGVIAGAAFVASRTASSSPNPGDREFRVAYPVSTPPTATLFAGVELGKLVVPGLRVSAREDRAAEDGAVVISLADASNEVRALIKVAVTPDATVARRIVDVDLHGIQSVLPAAIDPSLGDYAWADDAGKGSAVVVAAAGNVAYAVHVLEGASITASSIATQLRSLMPAGAPVFPTVHVTLPADVPVQGAGDVRVTTTTSTIPKLRAEGAYVAKGSSGPVVKPFGPGPIAVYATVVDDLGRVTVAKATSIAR